VQYRLTVTACSAKISVSGSGVDASEDYGEKIVLELAYHVSFQGMKKILDLHTK